MYFDQQEPPPQGDYLSDEEHEKIIEERLKNSPKEVLDIFSDDEPLEEIEPLSGGEEGGLSDEEYTELVTSQILEQKAEIKKIEEKVLDKEYLRYFRDYVPGYNPAEIDLPDHSIDSYDTRTAVLELKKALDEEHIDTEKSIRILRNFKFFLDNTEYVPYDTFLNSFKNSMDSFFSSLGKENYGIVINKVDPTRSNEWMINVFLSFLGNRQEPSFIIPMDDYLIRSSKFKEIKNVVMIDDVSYSGDQIVGYVMEFSQPKLEVQLHILLSYVTSIAKQKIREKSKEVKIYGTSLKNFAEKISDQGERIEDFIFCDYPLYKTNAVFQHKLADANSSYPEIYHGKFCFIDNNKKYKIEFSIPLIQNCDRSYPQCYKPFYSEQIPEKLVKLR